MRATRSLVLLMILLCAVTASAQTPTRWNNLRESKITRQVVVDSTAKHGDFADLSDALTWIALVSDTTDTTKLPRDQYSPWTVVVYPGKQITGQLAQYQEASLVIPDYVTIRGYSESRASSQFSAAPVLEMTGTSGALITLGYNTFIVDLDITYKKTPTVLTKLLYASTGAVGVLANVSVYASGNGDSFGLDLLSVAADAVVTLYDTNVTRSGTPATKTRGVFCDSSGGITIYGGKFDGVSGQLKLLEAASGVVRLFGVRLGTSPTTQLVASGSGSFETHFTQYATATGTVANEVLRASGLYVDAVTPASASATCKIGQVAADDSFLYRCVAADTWKRVAIATW